MHKLSFLIAAHNEEKTIGLALDNFKKIKKDYPNIEVLIGLDGCTDNTKKIIKKYSFIKYLELDKKEGKQEVLDELEKLITGDIVIIHDADWIFSYENKKDLIEFIKIFDNPSIGGITNCFSAVFDEKDIKKIKSLGFLANAWQSYYLVNFQKEYCTKMIDGKRYVDEKRLLFPFFLDFYKKKILDLTKKSKKLSAGDHIERTLRILNSGYKIRVIDNPNLPRFKTTYISQSLHSMFNQRKRGAIARSKIKSEYKYKIPLKFYYLFPLYLITHLYKMNRVKDYLALFLWWIFMFYATLIAFFKTRKTLTKDVWKMRIKR